MKVFCSPRRALELERLKFSDGGLASEELDLRRLSGEMGKKKKTGLSVHTSTKIPRLGEHDTPDPGLLWIPREEKRKL